MINVGRGDLIPEGAILTALERGWIRHFVGDVYETEPLPSDSPLWKHPQVRWDPVPPSPSGMGSLISRDRVRP